VDLRLFINFLINLIQLYELLILARLVISWLPNLDTYKQPWRGLIDVTEPVLGPFRKLVPPIGGVIDISPMVLFFVLGLIIRLLSGLL
jgi:YggT family protein